MGARDVRALVELDGGVRTMSKHIYKSALAIGSVKGTSITRLSTFYTVNGNHRQNLGFAFAQLKADGSIKHTSEEATKEALNRGTITVTIQRGGALRSQYNPQNEPQLPAMPSLETSEKVINHQG